MSSELTMFVAFSAVVAGTLLVVNRVLFRVRVARRLNLAAGGLGMTKLERKLSERSADIRGVVGRILAVLGGLLPLGEDDRQKIVVALQRAGYRSSNTVAVVLGCKAACLLAGLLAGLIVLSPLVPGLLGWGAGLVGGLLFGAILNLVPELVVMRLAASRTHRIHTALADAFDLLIVCLESGLTFERALQRTVADLKSFQPDLANELRQASLDMSVHGRTREDALGRLATRLDSREFRDLATTVSQSERHGTPLTESLRKLASSVRVQAIASMQARLARLPVLLILPTLAFVLPGIMVIVGGPAFVRLVQSLEEFGK
ncbi:MAG: type II secretion system F family protein [Gammaproteobacteria bacterium]|nr:type II secretion system F family protein [Gammaproteobacteria bacterium]